MPTSCTSPSSLSSIPLGPRLLRFIQRALSLCGALILGSCVGDAPPEEISGCDSTVLYESPQELEEPGPWDVGVRSFEVGRLTADVLYPAPIGSAEGLEPLAVDIRYALPESEQIFVTDEVRPLQSCTRCVRDLPVDEDHGPYPLIFFVHGTASWRMQSLSLMEHWASRGFVVVAADHPGLFLADMLSFACGEDPSGEQDLLGDLNSLHAALESGLPSLSFLDGLVDMDRAAVFGHSAGGNAAAAAAGLSGVQVIGSLASGRAVDLDGWTGTSFFAGGLSDAIVNFSQTQAAYEETVGSKRLIGIEGAGHLVFSDICQITNEQGQNLVEIATAAGVCGTEFASFLFDCAANEIPSAASDRILKRASTWVLQNDLHCNTPDASFDAFGDDQSWLETIEGSP